MNSIVRSVSIDTESPAGRAHGIEMNDIEIMFCVHRGAIAVVLAHIATSTIYTRTKETEQVILRAQKEIEI